MKVIELISENFKRLNVHVVMDGKSVVIEGKNGIGKSSVIDSIWVALTGKETPGKPIKDGKDSAKITVKVKADDGSVFIVEKKFTASGASLTVKTPEGAKFSSPQKFLDEKIGKISFDPFEFINKQPREQKKFLMELLNINFEDIDSEKVSLLLNKDKLSKEYSTLKQKIKEVEIKEGEPQYEEKNINEALKKFEDLNAEISIIKQSEKRFFELKNIKHFHEENLENIQLRIDDLIKEKEKCIEILTSVKNNISKFGESPSFNLPELSDIQEEIAIINTNNKNYALQEDRKEKSKKLNEQIERISLEGCNVVKKLKQLEEDKVKLISSVKMPVDGLSFGEDGLLFDGLPFEKEQLSTAKLIEIGIKISMTLNPALRIMRIKDGSLLDSETLEIIKTAVKQNDYQLFIERVSDSKEIGFIIEEENNNAN